MVFLLEFRYEVENGHARGDLNREKAGQNIQRVQELGL